MIQTFTGKSASLRRPLDGLLAYAQQIKVDYLLTNYYLTG